MLFFFPGIDNYNVLCWCVVLLNRKLWFSQAALYICIHHYIPPPASYDLLSFFLNHVFFASCNKLCKWSQNRSIQCWKTFLKRLLWVFPFLPTGTITQLLEPLDLWFISYQLLFIYALELIMQKWLIKCFFKQGNLQIRCVLSLNACCRNSSLYNPLLLT